MMLYQDTYYAIDLYGNYGTIATPLDVTRHSIAVCKYVAKSFNNNEFKGITLAYLAQFIYKNKRGNTQ